MREGGRGRVRARRRLGREEGRKDTEKEIKRLMDTTEDRKRRGKYKKVRL